MKYENFEDAKKLVELIQRDEAILNKLTDSCYIQIRCRGDVVIESASWGNDFHDEKTKLFIDELIAGYRLRIQTLKEKLSKL
jgi:hypothetical protein